VEKLRALLALLQGPPLFRHLLAPLSPAASAARRAGGSPGRPQTGRGQSKQVTAPLDRLSGGLGAAARRCANPVRHALAARGLGLVLAASSHATDQPRDALLSHC
jgi:hypothetical protein